MVGLGYRNDFQLSGSKRTILKMNIDDSAVIEISNPMSENYQFVRPSLYLLCFCRSCFQNAVYPHKVLRLAKSLLCGEENAGTRTRQSLGFLTASGDANYNTIASEIATLLYFLDHSYEVKETSDPRFIPGRQAGIIIKGKQIGIFGEIHPSVLENWAVTVPCAAGELDIEELL